LTGQLNEIISELERRQTVIDQAIAALRDVDGIASPTNGAVRKADDNKQLGRSRKKYSTVDKVGGATPTVHASSREKKMRRGVSVTGGRQAKQLTEGTMKARTVELLRKVGKPMHSGEVAKRMKIGSGYASVNLSQLRRDGFLNHTAAGYVVK
jgi:hypothetical protein